MIKIARITNLPFPKVDFKFINRGNAAAVLWKIGFKVENIDLDPTPVLSFSLRTRPTELALMAHNSGWGPAKALHIKLSGELLDKLFSNDRSHEYSSIEPGSICEVAKLKLQSASEAGLQFLDHVIQERRRILAILPDQMRTGDRSVLDDKMLRLSMCSYERSQIYDFFDNLMIGESPSSPLQQCRIEYVSILCADAAPVNNISINSSFSDIRGKGLKHAQIITFGMEFSDARGQLWLSRSGFQFEEYPSPQRELMHPTVTFVMMLDYSSGCTERYYRAALTIPAGEAERFLIAVGADRSCLVRAKFVFYFDGGVMLSSDSFEFSIWHPQNARVNVKDGWQFVRTEGGWQLADKSGRIAR